MAVGGFVVFSPTFGFQMIGAALLATLLRASRAAAIVSVWLTNPFTALPIYVMTYRAGRLLVPRLEAIDFAHRHIPVRRKHGRNPIPGSARPGAREDARL